MHELADILFLEANDSAYKVKIADIPLLPWSEKYCDRNLKVTGSYESQIGKCLICLAEVRFIKID